MPRQIQILAVALIACPACVAQAAADRFDYDPAGRLIRRVDDQSRGTDYVYDAAGNVLQVTAPSQALPPSITSGPLADQRRNDIRQVAVGGTGLAGVAIKTSHPGIVVSHVVQSATAINFRLAVSHQVPLGPQQLSFQGAAGSVSLPFNVLPAVAFAFVPEPISVAPDNIARKFSLVVGEPFAEAKTFSLSTLSPAIAKTSVTQISLPAGQTEANLGVIGVAQGTTLLRLSNTGLNEPVESLVFVSPGAANPSYFGAPVGISKGVPWSVSPTTHALSGPIGIAKGVPWSVSPTTQAYSGLVGIAKGLPWSVSPATLALSGQIGIAKGVPWSVSANAGPVIAPLVGIVKP
ncbi:RHS repeat domain-containing protein [Sulfuritalea sp.]|uniref:RHS repeat domain-containing protein n=1 Tax=Sulfuritalea sp. TaxID=2480090 RepID=UPI00286E8052|nr:RHS repeat domain-containing protein [Sulfuritalea sp.]